MASYRQTLGSVAVGLLLAACTENTGPQYPSLAGDYSGDVDMTWVNSVEDQSASSVITVSLDDPDRYGEFAGTFSITDVGVNISGPVYGFVDEHGEITITQFGDADPDTDFSGLQDLFWWCDLSTVSSTSFTGTVNGPDVTLDFFDSVPCYYDNTPYTTDIDLQISVVR